MEDKKPSGAWRWWVCALLLCASTINYMDRQTLSSAASRITRQFQLNQEQYGDLELVFGWGFAVGSLAFGLLVDRVSVRLLYPIALSAWSLSGVATGLVQDYNGLLLCRGLLGLFEAGHWPCALKTTQALLEPKDRAMGNSVLQSGTSVGAILTPLLMRSLMTEEASSWRYAFQLVGVVGLGWVAVWFLSIRSGSLRPTPPAPGEGTVGEAIGRLLRDRRFWVLVFTVVAINTCWQLLRAWLPKILQEGRGYAEKDTLSFTALFYVASDLGCLGAGAASLWLARRGLSVHRSRLRSFLGCALLTACTTLASFLPHGPALLGTLLIAGAGALGVFPCYYALTQELSASRQGLVSGLTGVFAWAFSAPAHKLFGRVVDRTGSFDLGLALAGWLPMTAFIVIALFWPKSQSSTTRTSV